VFASDSLDRMRRGTIELSVPLRDDVIQVAARGDGDTEIGRIRVAKGRETVTVIRVDGKPIQVDITTDQTCTTTTRVFCEPVRELRFRRTRDAAGQPLWCIEGEDVLLFVHQQGVKQFADTIATFAVRKQDAGRLVATAPQRSATLPRAEPSRAVSRSAASDRVAVTSAAVP
jgi:hypothetical protein